MWRIVRGDCSAREIHIHEKYKTTPFMADMCEDMACVLGEDEFYSWRWKNQVLKTSISNGEIILFCCLMVST